MATQGKYSIIHRKAQGGRLDFDARVMSPAKALRLSLAKSADKLLDLVLTVTTVEQKLLPHGKLQGEAGNDGLLIVLDGAGGSRGAVKFDMQFLAGLIEMQTTGAVNTATAVARPMTITDAAMVLPMVNAVLLGYDAELAEASPGHPAAGFRFGDMIEDGRALSLVLEAQKYDLYRLNVDFSEGAKTGVITLILPVQPQASEQDQRQGSQADGKTGFKGNALDAPVTMDAVVARLKLPLNEICQFEKGTLLPVPADCLSKTELVATGNHVVSEVLLGQMNGLKAVRFAASGVAPIDDPTGSGQASEMPQVIIDHGDSSDDPGDTLDGNAIEVETVAAQGPDRESLQPNGPGAGLIHELTMAGSEPSAQKFSELDELPQEV